MTPFPRERQSGYLLSDIAALGIDDVERVERSELYFLAGDLTDKDVRYLCRELLADPVVHRARWGIVPDEVTTPEGAVRVEVGLLPGVTDSVAANLQARASVLGMHGLKAASSAEAYLLYGDLSKSQAEAIVRRLLCNDVIQYYELGPLTPHVGADLPPTNGQASVVALAGLTDDELLSLSRERLLSLDLSEMGAIQAYFRREGREPTDVELESLAQTWSEHCVHKTFKAIVNYVEYADGAPRSERIDSLIRTYLQAATSKIDAPWVRSAFVDNAGILTFDDDYEVSFKAETHNHPSALEPFGGANTGVGGVVRDIMGVSARPIANTDILCFGPLDMSQDDLPAGVLHPRRIRNGVVHGVEDYGNKMGIPTVNGAIYYDPGYTANPLVYCGCVGIAPIGSHPRGARAGDLIVVLGGRTGRDGIHGATFSSAELTDETGVTTGGAVQIGNPITEKMVLDAILVARDEGLYSAITDCGAGGLSSAVSEMGEETGVRVDLDTVPLKYRGLQPWEIWLSESQERMVLAVPLENEGRLRTICERFSVEMVSIGTFTADGRLHLTYAEETVADLDMDFLHHGLPRRTLSAEWRPPARDDAPGLGSLSDREMMQALLAILADPNVRSKEDVVRLYDHEVQGGTVIKPFVGLRDDGPSDAAVLKPLEVADSWRGLALGCGFNPAYGDIDPYAMAVSAIDEAVRNVVAVGADPDRIAILDNFCWGNPLKPEQMGGLVRACKGCYDGALQYGTPFVSGKDSLNNEYVDGVTGQKVAIPPSLLISALGIVPDVRSTCTSDFKRAGDLIYILGETRPELGGSCLARMHGLTGGPAPAMAARGPETARALHGAIVAGLVAACHDCSEGGLAVALAEMAIGGGVGARVSLDRVPVTLGERLDTSALLYAESNGRYLVEIASSDAERFESLLGDVPFAKIGVVEQEEIITFHSTGGAGDLLTVSVAAARQAWNGHLGADVAVQEDADA